MAEIPAGAGVEETGVGSYFVANYPPFSVWTEEALADATVALAASPEPEVPLGLYLHIPFCRKRCHFCYFRVYTNKNSRQVEEYLDLLAREWEMYLDRPAVAERRIDFVYFGGGTPSFLSTQQLEALVGRLTARSSWAAASEVTFECEPGTLSESKLAALRDFGVTRLSLGVENFDDRILDINGRAHRSPEIFRVYRQARAVKFPQINIDLIAGMLGETDENWSDVCRPHGDAVARQHHHLPDGASLQHDHQREPAERLQRHGTGRRTGRRSAGGLLRPSRRSSEPAITSAARTPR